MYAIIATGGKQYKVSEGDIITIEKLGKEAGEKVTFDQVLAVSDNGIKVGSDVANASVEASVVKEGRGKKVNISQKRISQVADSPPAPSPQLNKAQTNVLSIGKCNVSLRHQGMPAKDEDNLKAFSVNQPQGSSGQDLGLHTIL